MHFYSDLVRSLPACVTKAAPPTVCACRYNERVSFTVIFGAGRQHQRNSSKAKNVGKGNNYGLKTRDLAKAGKFALNAAARDGNTSYSTAATVSDRWQIFATHAKEEGLKRLEQITPQALAAWGQTLAERVSEGDLSPAYAQNLVSAVNSVMNHATQGQWQSVSPTKDCGIEKRCAVRSAAPQGIERSDLHQAVETLRNAEQQRGGAVLLLARELGLRAKEASLLDARSALREAQQRGVIRVTHGTKGGRPREIPITRHAQREALRVASGAQGTAKSLVPTQQTWAQWEACGLRNAREVLQHHGIARIHELRAAYAWQRYQEITGQPPRLGGGLVSKAEDRAARLIIAQELGHSRVNVTVSYLGSMR